MLRMVSTTAKSAEAAAPLNSEVQAEVGTPRGCSEPGRAATSSTSVEKACMPWVVCTGAVVHQHVQCGVHVHDHQMGGHACESVGARGHVNVLVGWQGPPVECWPVLC